MTTMTNAGAQVRAESAAQAALALLPSSSPLSAGTPTSTPDAVPAGRAIRAQFAGGAQGEIVVVVAEDLVAALADTPLGALDLTQAVRPALEAAAGTLGPVVVDPGTLMEPAEALAAIVALGGVVVPLTDAGGVARAMLGLAVTVAAPAERARSATPSAQAVHSGLDLLHHVEMDVTAELGRTRMSVRDLISLTPGGVVELDRAAGGPADLLVNGRLIARGEVVVIDENFGIRITEIVPPSNDRT
jgi:flagellar motor switch protein FliN/FliY